MTKRRTWWAKLDRAAHHLAEFEAEFERCRVERNAYEIQTEVHAFTGGDMIQAQAFIADIYRDDIAAIVGDIVFNTRSALDHICVALSGIEEAMYPIFEQDISVPDPDPSGKDRSVQRRKRLRDNTKNMPAGAATFISDHQPYRLNPQFPFMHQLAVLNRLSNADKHRQLLVLSNWIYDVEVSCTFDGIEVPNAFVPPKRGLSGAVVGIFPIPPAGSVMRVDANGGTELALQDVGAPMRHFGLPDSLVNLVHYVRHEMIEPLDAFVL
jgi:hypothetical protein